MANGTTVAVNGSTPGWHPTVQDEILLALQQNGGIRRIEAAFRQRLDEAGWSQSLKEYCVQLFRSGRANTYDEAFAQIMKHVRFPGDSEDEQAGGGSDVPDLTIDQDVAEGGAEAIKKELKQVCVPKK